MSPTPKPALCAIEPAVTLDGQVEHVREQTRRNADSRVGDTDDRLILFPPTRTRIVPPGEVYLIAFVNRLATIWFRRVGSAFAQTGSARTSMTCRSRRPVLARSLTERWTLVARFKGLARQDDVAAGDVRDVEKVVDEPAQMGDLVADRASRPHGHVVLLSDAIEHADRADDRRQRVTQLVTQHRQELVLGPVGGFRLRPRELRPHQQILALSLHAPALLHERAGRDDHDGNRAHEELQQQKRFVRRGAGEGSKPRSVSQIAMPDRTVTSIAASSWRKRTAAHTSGGVHRNVSGSVMRPKRVRPSPNTVRPMSVVVSHRAAASATRPRDGPPRQSRSQRTRRGAKIRPRSRRRATR